MKIFELPVWVLNGKNYAFMIWLDSHSVGKRGLSLMENWKLDETDTEIVGRN
jgi:hypothetical protein